MQEHRLEATYRVYMNSGDLPPQYSKLLDRAKKSLSHSYAPYSDFQVAAAVQLANDVIVAGANQENASYPLCLCAERVALAAAAAQYPGIAPTAMAVTTRKGNNPATPCGACRQVIAEHEFRFQQPICLILQASDGPIYVFESIAPLLPLAFDGSLL